jgi:hypothetical protein
MNILKNYKIKLISAYGVVPNLIDVLASMLPMLGMAKQDVHKTAFASGAFFLEFIF